MRSFRSTPSLRRYLERIPQNDIHPLKVLQWTPPGACARAIERASTGHIGEALLWLAGSAAGLAALVAVWWWAQDRVATQGEFVFGAPGRRAHADSKRAGGQHAPRIPFLRPAVIAVAALDLRQMWRNPRRRMQTVNGLLMPVVMSVFWFGRAKFSGSLLALAPGIFVTFISLFVFQNLMAMDGLAVATVFLSPLDRRDVFRGKVLAFAAVAAGPVLLLCVLAIVRASVALGISGVLLAAGTFLIVAAVSSAISARVAVPIQEDRRSGPVRSNSAAGWTIALVQPTIIAVLLSPFWIPAAFGIVTGRPTMALGSTTAGLVYAAVVFHFGIKNAGAALTAREPEIFKMLDPKAL
jgi:ABC-2 type transport system permease protein